MDQTAELTNLPEWTVGELSGALRRTLEDRFGQVRVRGEIMGYRGQHASGHAYLCLKDRDARLDAVIWRTAFGRLRFKPQEGLEVVATGRITTFPGKSTYQLVIEQLEPAGAGALMALLEERRKRLATEGLFAVERKRPVPFLPRIVGVVTSPTGAVIRDILHRLQDRFPRHVVVWPVRVQGETCGAEVAAAIAGLNALGAGHPAPRPDVIIVARGGGSLEDLWGFNDEAVVRAAAQSRIPIISAIGHETDWTLLDHVADLRAPTPTGAAEMAVPVRSELVAQAAGAAHRHADGMRRRLEAAGAELRSAVRALPTPEGLLAPARQRVDLAAARLGPGLLANLREHERGFRRAADGLARHTPRLELATARARLDGIRLRPRDAIARQLAAHGDRLAELGRQLAVGRDAVLRAESLRLVRCRERLAEVSARRDRTMRDGLARREAALATQAGLLATLGYRAVLERGYALVRDTGGRAVQRAAEIGGAAWLEIEFADGRRRVLAEGAPARARSGSGSGRAARLAQESLFDQ